MRRTVRSLVVHFQARRRWLGKQYPRSSASSASAMRTSFGIGASRVDHAHAMTRMLTVVVPVA
jgi:hypothetical protein